MGARWGGGGGGLCFAVGLFVFDFAGHDVGQDVPDGREHDGRL